MDVDSRQLLRVAVSGCCAATSQHDSQCNTFGSDAEAMLEALVGVGAGDDFRAGTAYVHIPLVMHDVAGVALQPVSL